jgi:hypothetical protein
LAHFFPLLDFGNKEAKSCSGRNTEAWRVSIGWLLIAVTLKALTLCLIGAFLPFCYGKKEAKNQATRSLWPNPFQSPFFGAGGRNRIARVYVGFALCLLAFTQVRPLHPRRKRAQGFVVVRYRRRCGPAGGCGMHRSASPTKALGGVDRLIRASVSQLRYRVFPPFIHKKSAIPSGMADLNFAD